MEASTPEALNAQLLARIGELEREVADLRARVAKGRPALPSVDDIRRVRRAAHGALVTRARSLTGTHGMKAELVAADFLRVFDALLSAAKSG